MDWRTRHIELIEALNATPAHSVEEREARAMLRGFREGIDLAFTFSMGHLVIEGDWRDIDQGVERPMCGGEFSDKATRGES